ncbi:MAG: hypothetical protein LBV04_09595 [Deferribacteraceae bacterium]|nr:hypothetical protein [Deferribacteraceae bacterium]
MLENMELNSDMQENLDTFFKSNMIGQKVSFINRQLENPDMARSEPIELVSITIDDAMDILKTMHKQVWG